MLVIVRLRSLGKPIGQVYGSHLLGVFFIILPDEVCGEFQKPLEDSIFPVLVYVYYFPREDAYFNRFHTPEASVFLSRSVGFALYSGNGRKTTMGLGRVFPR